MRLKNEQGFSMMEIIITVVLMAIMAGMALGYFKTYRERASIERDIKAIYSLLQEARFIAFSNKRDHYVDISGNSVELYYNNGGNRVSLKTITLEHTFESTSNDPLHITDRGTFANQMTIKCNNCNPNLNPAYNCISVSTIRAKMGVLKNGECEKK